MKLLCIFKHNWKYGHKVSEGVVGYTKRKCFRCGKIQKAIIRPEDAPLSDGAYFDGWEDDN